MFSWS